MEKTEGELKRQARWQLTRGSLSWPEKVRMAEHVRASVEILQHGRPSPQAARPKTQGCPRPSAQR